ncbi:hypothetical protein GCM10022280_26110 [Sphingomonas swuensis]|uniref:TonB C-terminal domain-containing protein n=1 Tax=Sphingomonas swuensis TaxID=977800 RepID=A0ABP7TC53_9SPHN
MPWQRSRNDRLKSAVLVVGVHAAIGLALLSGLAGEPLRRATDALVTIDVAPPPPPPEPPLPQQPAEAAREAAGSPDLEARPAPVVLPPPPVRLPLPTPLPTAEDRAPDTAAAPSAGAAPVDGPGRGADGSGDGTGGGGSGGAGAGGGGVIASGARLLSGNLTRRDYRRIRSFGSPRGEAVLALTVSAEGSLLQCLPLTGSGNPSLDAELCRLLARTRWDPARDGQGRAVPAALRYVATWNRD